MDVRKIRGWLLCQPRPAKLRVVSEDQQTHELDVGPGARWKNLAVSIHSLEPVQIQALDREGKLIRACKPDDVDDEPDDGNDDDEPDEQPRIRAHADGTSALLSQFGNQLAKAYEKSHAFMETAFAALRDIAELGNKRAESLERTVNAQAKTIERLQQERIDEAAARAADAGGDPVANAIASGFARKMGIDPDQLDDDDDEPDDDEPATHANGKSPS